MKKTKRKSSKIRNQKKQFNQNKSKKRILEDLNYDNAITRIFLKNEKIRIKLLFIDLFGVN